MNTTKIAKTTSFAVLAIAAVGMLALSTAIAKPAFASSDKDNHDNERHNNHENDAATTITMDITMRTTAATTTMNATTTMRTTATARTLKWTIA